MMKSYLIRDDNHHLTIYDVPRHRPRDPVNSINFLKKPYYISAKGENDALKSDKGTFC